MNLTAKAVVFALLCLPQLMLGQLGFSGFWVEDVPIDDTQLAAILADDPTWVGTPRCWRVHACVDGPDLYELQIMYGDDVNPWILNCTSPFYQYSAGTALSSFVTNPVLFDIAPASEFDSWFTINSTWGGSYTSVTPPFPGYNPFTLFENGNGFFVNDPIGSSVFGAWGTGSSEGTPDTQNKVLVAQFTVEGSAVVSGAMNFQFRRLNADLTIYDPITVEQITGVVFDNTTFTDVNTCMLVFLPISLTAFEVQQEVDRVRLDWRTESEQNADYFAVERSLDGENFEELKRLPAAGNSVSTVLYTSYDFDPHPGWNYYRLKLVDTNGEYDYSEIRSVEYTPDQLSVYPNPVKDVVNLTGLPRTADQLALTDLHGKTVISEQLDPERINTSLNLGGLSTGVYMLKVLSSGAVIHSERLVVNPR